MQEYQIIFYKTADGYSPVLNWMEELREKNSRDSRVQLTQLDSKLKILQQCGTRALKDSVKHIDGKIWEIRPGKNRVLLFMWTESKIVLLHQFRKKRQEGSTARDMQSAKRTRRLAKEEQR